MEKIRFALLGCGWRGEFYLRIVKALPQYFELAGVWVRNQEKADSVAKTWGVPVYTDLETLLATKPSFAVVSLPWQPMYEFSKILIERGVNVLSETPAAPDLETLSALYFAAQKAPGKILVAEQFQHQPMLSAAIEVCRSGLIGSVTNVNLSFCHGYHAMNLIRQFLNIAHQPVRITGRQIEYPVLNTKDRFGDITDNSMGTSVRELALLEFEGGKTALYDFSGTYYHTWVRSRNLLIQGTHGEICNDTVRFMNQSGQPCVQRLSRLDVGSNGDLEGIANRAVMMGDRAVYTNPFPGARLSDEELAVASRLVDMQQYLLTGNVDYSLNDALEDAYLSLLLMQAISQNCTCKSSPQPWM